MAVLIGTGFCVPDKVITNIEISDSWKWIVENTGIRERRIGMTSTDLGAEAAMRAIENAGKNEGIRKEDIDMIIVATSTPDKIAPSTACLIRNKLNLNAVAFDVNAVCSGFLFALSVAENYTKSGYNNVLVIGVDTYSQIIDWEHRDCIYFGDGAGAVILSSKESRFYKIIIRSEKMEEGFICEHGQKFVMKGSEVYKSALRLLPAVINEILNDCFMVINHIDYMVPHQPAIRILKDVSTKIGIPFEKVLTNMDKYGNTAAATIPILLAENWHRFKRYDTLLFASIGSGWNYGAAIYEV